MDGDFPGGQGVNKEGAETKEVWEDVWIPST